MASEIGPITPYKVSLWWKKKISSSNIAISDIVEEEKSNQDVSSEASLPLDRKKTATLTRRKTFHGQIVVDSKPKVPRLQRSRWSVSDDSSLSSAGSSLLQNSDDLATYQLALQKLAKDDRWKKETALGTRIAFYRLYRDVGKGNFSKVKMGMHYLTKEKVAVKIIDKSKLQPKNRLSKEVSAMESIEHPHIIRLFEVVETPSRLFLAMEFAEGGDLLHRVASGGRIPENDAKYIFVQVAAAVDHLHKHNIIHRDLKAESVFVSDKNTVKIGDFGFSTRVQNPRETLLTLSGSPPYIAPEIFQNEAYPGHSVDMWSMGVLLFFMVTASLPFKGETVSLVKRKILAGHFIIPKYVSKDCSDLISGLLQLDSNKRFGIIQVKSSAWVKGVCFPVPRNGKNSLREKEVMEKLGKMGITEQLLQEHRSKGARSSVIGSYRIVMHKVESSYTVDEKENPVKALIRSCPTFKSKTCTIL